MDAIELYREAGELFLDRLADVVPSAWPNETPCPGWSVRTVAAHVVNGFAMMPTLLRGETLDPATRNRDALGDDPVAVARSTFADSLAALDRPGALAAVVSPPQGPMPMAQFAVIRAADTTIHTWDMCRGAGIEARIPAELARSLAAATPRAALENGRAAGAFGAEVHVEPDADAATALLALFGRTG